MQKGRIGQQQQPLISSGTFLRRASSSRHRGGREVELLPLQRGASVQSQSDFIAGRTSPTSVDSVLDNIPSSPLLLSDLHTPPDYDLFNPDEANTVAPPNSPLSNSLSCSSTLYPGSSDSDFSLFSASANRKLSLCSTSDNNDASSDSAEAIGPKGGLMAPQYVSPSSSASPSSTLRDRAESAEDSEAEDPEAEIDITGSGAESMDTQNNWESLPNLRYHRSSDPIDIPKRRSGTHPYAVKNENDPYLPCGTLPKTYYIPYTRETTGNT